MTIETTYIAVNGKPFDNKESCERYEAGIIEGYEEVKGKTKFYDYVRELLRCNNMLGETYMEPFAGGAGLALKLLLNNDVKRIIINDYDTAIYSFWHSILYETDAFCELINTTPVTTEEWKKQREIYMNHNGDISLDVGFSTFFLNRTNVSGVIKGGMIPKIDCCVESVRMGVERAHIIDGRVPHSIILELLSPEGLKGLGTMIY